MYGGTYMILYGHIRTTSTYMTIEYHIARVYDTLWVTHRWNLRCGLFLFSDENTPWGIERLLTVSVGRYLASRQASSR